MTTNDHLNKAIIEWASQYLSSRGYTLKSQLPEKVQNTPWSQVVRFVTSGGNIYLKHTPKLLALEAHIIQILHSQFHASVPEVLTHNHELDCFLMRDAGKSLREVLKKQFDVELVCKALDQFTSLQSSVADHVDVLLDSGVPDWRLHQLPELYAQLLTEKNLLIEDGLSEKEVRELKKLTPEVTDLCNKLSAYAIKQTLVQPDFNDNNTLIDDKHQKMTIIDLGEIAISHPFFSLLNFLYQIKKHHALNDEDSSYIKIKETCLNPFMAFESRENVLNAFALAYPLWFIYGAIAGFRLINACGQSTILSYQHGKFVASLREFMTTCRAE